MSDPFEPKPPSLELPASIAPVLAELTAATIASQIDTTTVAGHNLRALLLRMLDGDDDSGFWNGRGRVFSPHACPRLAIAPGVLVEFKPGAKLGGVLALTPLGREAAERLRPEPWRAEPFDDFGRVVWRVANVPYRTADAQTFCEDHVHAERLAALLTADDLRAAKAYRTEAGS